MPKKNYSGKMDEDLLMWLKEQAKKENRTVNNYIEWTFEQMRQSQQQSQPEKGKRRKG